MMAALVHRQHDSRQNRIGRKASIDQGTVRDINYGLPHPPARAEVVRIILCPRNEDLVHRRDLIDRLDKLLPSTPGSLIAEYALNGEYSELAS
ncbi:hypothetical protein EDB81DRAFT_812888 [Dactylonectria macrodidyma]|uniref:Uncharacterized protein n=1 Tax=Dactylonectria macrodidyma TaxID=307937 RepID=A0A9P9IL67_9HYPO|nr:hypothetical protein EDB81DRAFT_812888 [Dactylonectria macrodidyma]